MPSWSDLLGELNARIAHGPLEAGRWLNEAIDEQLRRIGVLRGNPDAPRNVILYGSAWLQKPGLPMAYLSVMPEDINGFMAVMHGMDWQRNLTLIVHSPGGAGIAAQTIMSYLHTKFDDIEVVVPTYAMSAGTMLALGADRLIMGRQSQLGPIDAQLHANGQSFSAAAVVAQFETAKNEIAGAKGNPANAHVWAPILQSLGPSLLQEARMALDYGAGMVSNWLEKRMCKDSKDPAKAAAEIAAHFNAAEIHKAHGKRIDRDEARSKGLPVEDLEGSADLQEAVLTAYHLMTIAFETSAVTKCVRSSNPGRAWNRNYQAVTSPPHAGQQVRGMA